MTGQSQSNKERSSSKEKNSEIHARASDKCGSRIQRGATVVGNTDETIKE